MKIGPCDFVRSYFQRRIKIMAYEILVLDIDGTLTNSEKLISERTKQAIFDLQERGHLVVLASGRPTPGIMPLAKQLKMEQYGGYILSYNGAKVIDCKTGEVIYQKTLPATYIQTLYDAAIEFDTGLITYDKDGVVSARKVDEYVKVECKINKLSVKEIDDFVSYVNYPVNKCLMTGDGLYLAKVEEEMKKRLGDVLSIYRSEPFFLEIMPQNIDKAYSLGKLLDHLGLSKEQMICCGDGFNDVTMIEYAGMGVAMENATQVVKDKADFITLSNDNDGVAHVIEKFM